MEVREFSRLVLATVEREIPDLATHPAASCPAARQDLSRHGVHRAAIRWKLTKPHRIGRGAAHSCHRFRLGPRSALQTCPRPPNILHPGSSSRLRLRLLRTGTNQTATSNIMITNSLKVKRPKGRYRFGDHLDLMAHPVEATAESIPVLSS